MKIKLTTSLFGASLLMLICSGVQSQNAMADVSLCGSTSCPTPTPSPSPAFELYRVNEVKSVPQSNVFASVFADCGPDGVAISGGVDCGTAVTQVYQTCPSEDPATNPVCSTSTNFTRYWFGFCYLAFPNNYIKAFAVCLKK